jgi:tetratricopeptide (TPR) repeat protein/DNA-binding SARP family transcriptional activator
VTTIDFRALGGFQLYVGQAPVPLGSPRRRTLLAVLLASANETVPALSLIEELWPDGPPRHALANLRTYASELRRQLPAVVAARTTTLNGGYQLEVRTGEFDLWRLREQYAVARVAIDGGHPAGAVAALEPQQPMLRNDAAFAGVVAGPILEAVRAGIAEECRRVREAYFESCIMIGAHLDVVGALRSHVRRYPLGEHGYALLMAALSQAGDNGAALEVYRQARQLLITELGIEPGSELRNRQQSILRGELVAVRPASVAPPPAAGPGPGPARGHARLLGQEAPAASGQQPVTQSGPLPAVDSAVSTIPRQLPGAVPHFTGRDAELAALTALLEDTAAGGTAVLISAIGGTAGVGKTALAVHWAHQVASRFPDGQLYVNLRGYDPDQPVPAGDALAGFLRALGVADQAIPAEPGERAATYRSLLAGRRMLVLLDNASTTEQVRPLLPGASGCVTVVTSRDSLAGLVARDGARRLNLDLLPIGDAVGLLRALIGHRVDADPAAAAVLAEACARLPLALRVAAELAVNQSGSGLAGLAGELADQQRRLDLLEVGDDHRTAVRAVFSWSYRHLPPAAARAFRLLGLHPGPDFDRHAAAALTGVTHELARRLADQLARAHLIYASGPGRYGMHDLLRGYARELAVGEDGEDAQRAALTSLFDYYLTAAAAAIDTLFPSQPCEARAPVSGRIPQLTTPAAARAWLDAERATLVAVSGYTATRGWPGHTTRLSAILFSYFDLDGHYSDARSVHTHALQAASSIGDRAAHAHALVSLAGVDWRQGQHRQAAGRLEQALAAFRESGDRGGQARTLGNLGVVLFQQGHYEQAGDHLRQALAALREVGDRGRQLRVLDNLGSVLSLQGQYEQAAGYHRQALAGYREIGDRSRQASVLDNLGAVLRRQGRYSQAHDCLREALALFREVNGRLGEASALDNLGALLRCEGRYEQAADCHQRALAGFREIGDKDGETRALNGLGEVYLAIGQAENAQAQHAAALSLGSQIGASYQQARAQTGLARACAAAGDLALARHHQEQALGIYAELGVPEARELLSSPSP